MAASLIDVPFAVNVETEWGSWVQLVGSAEELGAWRPEEGVSLQTSSESYPQWRAIVSLPADAVEQGSIEYKFVIFGPEDQVDWEDGANRRVTLEAPADIVVFGQHTPESPRLNPTTGYRIIFEAECQHTLPGDILLAVGADPALGCWDTDLALRLNTLPTSFPRWCGTTLLGAGCTLAGSWKLAIYHQDGAIEWEPGYDRLIVVPADMEDIEEEALVLRATWGNTDVAPTLQAAKPSELLEAGCLPFAEALATKRGGLFKVNSINISTEDHDVLDCRHFTRPSSTASTASTCAGSDEGNDAHLLFEAKPFSPEVFEGLFGADLKEVLRGKVLPPPSSPSPTWLWSGAHRTKKPCGRCEDAFFHNAHALGVADGVGSMVQFEKYGTDSAAYAAELMKHASKSLEKREAGQSPESLAAMAIAAAEEESRGYGASTITVLAMEGNQVGIANLGDSGFMLLRKALEGWEITERSQEQQHYWNCPYQLARFPPALMARLPEDTVLDTAADNQQYSLSVRPGDLLLLFTDGMCDNLNEDEILQIVDRALAPAHSDLAGLAGFATHPERVARALTLAAQERSLDESAAVPFWENSRRCGQEYCLGGKPDDITVVAAWVMPTNSQ